MDIRRDGWFGAVTISGVRTASAHRGSIMSIVAESLKDIAANRSRPNEAGESEIVIRIRNKPFDASKDSVRQLEKAEEVTALLESDPESGLDDVPRQGESYAAYYDRLLVSGYPKATAELLAGQWFDMPIDMETQLWLNDPKARRFRELNSSSRAYQAALPSEYESLKNYVRTTYPQFVEHMTFRTA